MTISSQSDWSKNLLLYAHIGDLHIVDRATPNYQDFLAIVAEIEAIGSHRLDFVFLPGDNADNGTDAQYALVASGLRMLRLPCHVITGDHDMETGSLAPFYRSLTRRELPYTQTVRGVDCAFLDMCGEGEGGPDFRLPARQTDHLKATIDRARRDHRPVAVFMHTYPADLVEAEEKTRVNVLLADPAVRLVDMGHTHYNELGNDGRTIFAATRSTGQVEEGAVGYTVAAVDGGHVSWRFKPLGDTDPFVVVTSPSDRRLRLETFGYEPSPEIHAVVLTADTAPTCEWRGDGGAWQPMTATRDGRGFQAKTEGTFDRVEVRAVDASGREGVDAIELTRGDPRDFVRDGSDRDVIEAWPERHLLGTQLGPNRNGRKW